MVLERFPFTNSLCNDVVQQFSSSSSKSTIKLNRIEKILNQTTEDFQNSGNENQSSNLLDSLKHCALSRSGFANNSLRIKCWPLILSIFDVEEELRNLDPIDEFALQNHRDYAQVGLDVNRTLKRFPPGMNDVDRMALQEKLISLIMRLLVDDADRHYYQGFHDVCVTFLLVLDENTSFILLRKLCQTHFKDFLGESMKSTSQILNLINPILWEVAPRLVIKFRELELQPFFCLSWVITWFGHVMTNVPQILRMYDFLLASPPLMSIYVSASLVLHRIQEASSSSSYSSNKNITNDADRIYDDDDAISSTFRGRPFDPFSPACDFSALHHFLSDNAAIERSSCESLIRTAMHMYAKYPPQNLILRFSKPVLIASPPSSFSSSACRGGAPPFDWLELNTIECALLSECRREAEAVLRKRSDWESAGEPALQTSSTAVSSEADEEELRKCGLWDAQLVSRNEQLSAACDVTFAATAAGQLSKTGHRGPITALRAILPAATFFIAQQTRFATRQSTLSFRVIAFSAAVLLIAVLFASSFLSPSLSLTFWRSR